MSLAEQPSSTASAGFGYLAFHALASAANESPLVPKRPHFAPKAKRVIFLCMRGGPSHLDTFDYKPKLQADGGKPSKYAGSQLFPSLWDFKQRGNSGLWITDAFPHLAQHADDLCLLRGMHCDQPNHAQAFVQMHTGSFQFVRPSMGAWSLYGLGTENQQRAQIDLINQLNREKLRRDQHSPLVEGAIESYELAFRMQDAVPEVMDFTNESDETFALYGINEDPTDGFGRQCLLARRFAEAGVRFIQLGHGSWDQHANIKTSLGENCVQTDKPIAGLLADLKRRDLLKDTLVIWGGEFGRTSYSPDANGRDHNHKGYTTWMAGGGVKGGFSHGETDDHGYEAVACTIGTQRFCTC